MAKITATTYRSDNAGSSWYARDAGSASYINLKGSTNQTCYSFSYTPPSGYRIKQMVFTCAILAVSGYSWTGPYTVELYQAALPNGNPIATTTESTSITNTKYTDVPFAIDIPDSVNITSTSLCIGIYGPYSQGWTGTVEIIEEQSGTVRIGNGSSYDKHLIYIGNGSSFEQYVPYIGDGTNWNLYSG